MTAVEVRRRESPPVPIEAMQFDGTNGDAIKAWCGQRGAPWNARPGDWIVLQGRSCWLHSDADFAERFEVVA